MRQLSEFCECVCAYVCMRTSVSAGVPGQPSLRVLWETVWVIGSVPFPSETSRWTPDEVDRALSSRLKHTPPDGLNLSQIPPIWPQVPSATSWTGCLAMRMEVGKSSNALIALKSQRWPGHPLSEGQMHQERTCPFLDNIALQLFHFLNRDECLKKDLGEVMFRKIK